MSFIFRKCTDLSHVCFLLQLQREQDIPVEVQSWIIGKRICSDHASLASCDITQSGFSVYVYIMTANKTSLSREEYERRKSSGSGGVRPQRRVPVPTSAARLSPPPTNGNVCGIQATIRQFRFIFTQSGAVSCFFFLGLKGNDTIFLETSQKSTQKHCSEWRILDFTLKMP